MNYTSLNIGEIYFCRVEICTGYNPGKEKPYVYFERDEHAHLIGKAAFSINQRSK